LKGHCDAVGRPYEQIEKTTLGTVTANMTSRGVIALCQQLAGVGVQHAIFNFSNVHEITPLEMFIKEVIPAVAGL
jgi:hypothetical protein